MRHTLLPFIFFLAIITAQAQTKLSTAPAEFITDAKALLIAGKGEDAERLAAELEEVWSSGKLTPKQQQKVIDVAQLMYRKRLRSRPHFEQFFKMLTGGINHHNLRGNQLDNMLEVTAKAVQQEEGVNLDRFLTTSSRYLTAGILYQSKYYTLRALRGSFSFAYEGKSKEAAAADSSSDGWDNISWDDEVTEEGELIDDGWGNVVSTPKKADPLKEAQKRRDSFKKTFIPDQPKVMGPVLKFENVDLAFATQFDSSAILKTSGQLMLVSNQFVGEGGTYDWAVNAEPVSALFRKYNFDITGAAFKVPDVTLTYAAVLDAPIEGAFEFRSTKRGKDGAKLYPRFASFTNDAKVKNLGSNIAYTGGFTLAGDVVGSKPLDGSLSEIVVSMNGERKFRSMARNYNLNDSVIFATRGSVAIYQQKDSLTHPAMQLRYSKPLKKLILTRDKGPYSKTPFYDTYHRLEITAERLIWNLETPEINFSIINTKTLIPVQLESTHYYSNNRYQQLVGVATFHPLQALVAYAAKAKSSEFYVADVARYTKISEKALREAALNLSREGYLNYNPQSEYITLKQKAWHYVGASRKANDYDHLVIKSVVPSGKNATLNLTDNKLTVRGVDKISFNNDTASVYILPRGGEIHILGNRDIDFDGQIFASRLAFKGSDFKFNYDEFMIDMQRLDTVALVSKKRDATNGKPTNQVLTNRGKMSGKLYINKPDNKSGKEFYPQYPKFDAPMGAQVAFNKPDVLGGAYDSTVYFDIPPFKLDSLSAGKGGIAFEGTFHSGGIFPPIKTKLAMMPDETFGFYYQPSASGLPAFGGKGIAFDTIMMSSSGIQSKGTLKYLTGTFESPEYTYYLDAVTTKTGTRATLEPGGGSADFPQATFASYEMNWLPKQDTMYIATAKDPMKVYKEEYQFKGTAKLSPGGLYASGELDNPEANVVSDRLLFRGRSFSGNHAQMIVKSDVKGRPAVKAQDVAINYDLTNHIVDFGSEQKGVASIEFPKAQYKTSMSSARWEMNQQKVSLKADESGGKNYFYSQHPQQEGLRFSAESGEYDLKQNTVLAGGVPYISVGDVYVIPDSGRVAVAADATIRTLRNARIMADSVQQFHKLYAGNIDVLSRKAFKGDAIHDYYNAASDSFMLQFSDFVYGRQPKAKKKEALYTFAIANVDEAKKFYIFPRVLYRGKVMMHANKPHMDFDGDLKLMFTGNEADSDWFPYKKDSLNPTNARIPIIKPKMADGTPLFTGLHISRGTSKLYNTFVSRKQDDEDLDLFMVEGDLSYDKSLGEFKIGHKERAYGDSYEGNVLRYNEVSNTVLFEGKLNLVSPMKNFAIESSGNGSAKVDSSRYHIDALLAFDLNVPAAVLTAMAKGIVENAGGAGEAVERSDAMLYKLGELIGNREVRKYRDQMDYVPLPKLSKNLVRSILFSKVDLRWSNERNAWYSVGKLNLASMLKEDVNAQLDGFMELRQDMNGEPAMNLYIQAGPYTWYYLSFFENGLTLASSDDKFNKAVRSKAKGGRGASSNYAIYAGEPIEKNQFVEQFRRDYLQGGEGFKLAADEQVLDEGGFEFADEAEDEKNKKTKKKKKKKGDPFGMEDGVGSDNQ